MDIRKMFDNAFYNGGYEELTMDEQDEYISFLKDLTGFASESYTPYVPFVSGICIKLYHGEIFYYSVTTSSFLEIFWPS